MLLYQMVRQQIDVKLIYQDFRKTVPKEKAGATSKRTSARHFDETQLKMLDEAGEGRLPGRTGERALQAKGSSLDRERRIFKEQFVAQQWARRARSRPTKTRKSRTRTCSTYYQAHLKDFEEQPKVRWEELMVSFARHPNRDEAYAALAALGNRVLAGAAFAEVAKSDSDGPTAQQGGQCDWTHQGSLNSEALNQALFSLPVGPAQPDPRNARRLPHRPRRWSGRT